MSTKLSYYQSVKVFHEVFGHPVATTPQLNLIKENPALVKLRLDLINEEFGELHDAVKDHNLIEVLDAVGDLTYVVNGMGLVFGIDLDKYTITENFNYSLPNQLQKNLINENWKLVSDRIGDISQDIINLETAVSINNFYFVAQSLFSLMCSISSLAKIFGFDLDEVFRIVHESNMTKTCKNEQEAMDTIEHYKTLPGFESVNVKYRPSNDGTYYVVYNFDTGKILKSKYFQLPNFDHLVA